MPEGHVVHRLAARYLGSFGGRTVAVSSPQGRFADSASRVDGRVLESTEAHGKQLFLGFGADEWVRIHLGIYGKVAFGRGEPPAPVGAIRLRMVADDAWSELRGPAACELIGSGEKADVVSRLGPDPLRADADPERAWERIRRSRSSIATLLMDQHVIAGAGNIFRAEVLFRRGIDPLRAGRDLTRAEWDAMWTDLKSLMDNSVHVGRIDTVRPEHTPEAMGRPPRVDDHGGEVYVYRRAAQDCHVCRGPISMRELAGRNLFWCPSCQNR
ncbi:MAG TPA: DNA-formamidopyrimidine glycosylase family protein [Stackebrandtia sp.]|jgi:endonuclease-8|uniref:Fpg/Nei family DNA glycosylase n=1 Tax=Stackebrandtia sp. TaxID=2023065 RepID=UPI002D2234D6|nr:DNA-formamidopyrimidine glycosylase family protein [Stackebrandtia sp.]HZE40059.1 DNA-formamidopyrimidine glycosylase family protein [Stackebrandtia sp.]